MALVLAVQSGMLDALPLAAVMVFRQGLHNAMDEGAADAVRMIETTGTLDKEQKAKLLDALKRYAQTVAPATPA